MSYLSDSASRDVLGWLRITAGCVLFVGALLAWDVIHERRVARQRSKRIDAELTELLDRSK